MRRQKLNVWRKTVSSYPAGIAVSSTPADIIVQYAQYSKNELEKMEVSKSLSGRIMLKRSMAKSTFLELEYFNTRIQLYVSHDASSTATAQLTENLDLGDIILITGTIMKTKTGELTIYAYIIELLSKNIRPLPEKYHGITDIEQKYRQRYLDLICNPSTKQLFINRSRIISSLREWLVSLDYLEVETPMMHSIPGGASAKPFITHHNALNMDLYLRIAPELYLKQLIIGGCERVFEINRNFRNEGLSTRHNPEFTMLELYESYANWDTMRQHAVNLIQQAARAIAHINSSPKMEEDVSKNISANNRNYNSAINSNLTAQNINNNNDSSLTIIYQNHLINLANFDTLSTMEAMIRYNDHYTVDQLTDKLFLGTELTKLGYTEEHDQYTLLRLQFCLFELTTEDKLIQPTFITGYPIEISPLARASDTDETLAERFELFIAGRELANGYSELNDPEKQEICFRAQTAQTNNPEAMHYDANYIKALEYGMPPTGGLGIGIDRLVMLLTNSLSIKDVILFPQMRGA